MRYRSILGNKESTSKEIGVLVCPFIAAFPNFIFFSSPQIQTIQIIRIKVFTAICKLISISDIPHTFRISFLISNSCILFALDKLEKIVTTTNTIRETIKVPNIAPPNTMIFFKILLTFHQLPLFQYSIYIHFIIPAK